MPYYIPNLVDKTTCIGNTLSTFNISFSSLDTNLYNLSTYTVNSVNFLSSTMISVSSTLNSRINFLSSAMISVSSTLNSRITTLSSNLSSLSGFVYNNLAPAITSTQTDLNALEEYITYGLFYVNNQPISVSTSADGQNLSINFSPQVHLIEKRNAQIILNHNINLSSLFYAPYGSYGSPNMNGLNGTISVFIGTAGKSITGFGPLWSFTGGLSALNTSLSARNLIHYYVDVVNNTPRILAELRTF